MACRWSMRPLTVNGTAGAAARPTLFYVHGSGYTWGNKFTNGNKAGFAWYFERFVKAGYSIVSIDYAFAPEYHYPTPVPQIGEAICFLREHPEYSISLNEVVFLVVLQAGS